MQKTCPINIHSLISHRDRIEHETPFRNARHIHNITFYIFNSSPSLISISIH